MSSSLPVSKEDVVSDYTSLQNHIKGQTRVVISGVSCNGCADEIECNLRNVAGVIEATVDDAARRIEVLLDDSRISDRKIRAHIEAMGYPIDPDGLGEADRDVEARTGEEDARDIEGVYSHSAHHHRHHGIGCAHPPYRSSPQGPGRWVPLIGTVSGIVCLIHCAAVPILMSVLVVSPALADGPLEFILIGVTMVLAWVAILTGYRHHKRLLPPVMLVGGSIVVLLTHTSGGHGHSSTNMVGLFGMGLLIASIWTNRHYIRNMTYPVKVEHVHD